MTVLELYKHALNIMFEKTTSKVYDPYYKDHINLLLANTFDINNALRFSLGKEELTEIPRISDDEDVIPYELFVCYEVLPFGLAARFCIDDDLNKYQIYNAEYLNACFKVEKSTATVIEDVYV